MYGWPMLVHYCERCNYNTPVEYSGTVFAQLHVCKHVSYGLHGGRFPALESRLTTLPYQCGSSSPGADIAGQSKGAMNAAQHDELAQLFAQNMQLSHQHQTPAAHHQQEQTPVEHIPEILEKKLNSPIAFASAHYTGTAHVRAETQSEPSRSPPPPYHEALMPEAMAETLRQHSIDPSALLPNQIDLFLNADYEQRLRLLELWRISPPSYPLEQHLQARFAVTSVEKEESEARERYEKQMQARGHAREEHMLDTVIVEPVSPISQPGMQGWPPAARMRSASIAAEHAAPRPAEAEPYIVNGYEIAMNRHAVDPVYAATGLWQAPSYAQATQSEQESTMADQYGMYEQIRNHADWERMNEQMARQQFAGQHSMDEDMVM